MELIENSNKVALYISMAAEYKIRALCSMLPNREWSGVLFYEVEGGFDDLNAMKLHVKDFMTLDIGSGTFTEFEMTPDVCAYMVENNLLNCQTGLIHSHNTMSTFFSSVDKDTLLKKGSQQTHFLSLIVNNAGEYNAAITAQVNYPARVMQAYMMTYGDKKIEKSLSESEDKAVMYFKAHIMPNESLEKVRDEVKKLFEKKAEQETPSPHVYTPTPDCNSDKDNKDKENKEALEIDDFKINEVLKAMFSAEMPEETVKGYDGDMAFEDFCNACEKVSVSAFNHVLDELNYHIEFHFVDYKKALDILGDVKELICCNGDIGIPEWRECVPYYRSLVEFMKNMAEDDATEKLFESYLNTGRI